jgi:hypothetical protein
MRRVHEIIVAVEKHYVLHISLCVCVFGRAHLHVCVRAHAYLRMRAWARGCRRVRARVVLLIQLAKRMLHIVICGLSGSPIFFDIIS